MFFLIFLNIFRYKRIYLQMNVETSNFFCAGFCFLVVYLYIKAEKMARDLICQKHSSVFVQYSCKSKHFVPFLLFLSRKLQFRHRFADCCLRLIEALIRSFVSVCMFGPETDKKQMPEVLLDIAWLSGEKEKGRFGVAPLRPFFKSVLLLLMLFRSIFSTKQAKNDP